MQIQLVMLKRFKYARFIAVFLGTVYGCAPLYAQRAQTTVERNEEAQQVNELYKRGKWEEGRKLAESNLKSSPRDADMRMLLGKYYLHHKAFDKARYELVKSLDYVPSNVESKQMLVAVETETKRYSSAICYINELLEVNPYWKGLWRKKIGLYRDMGNHVEADRLLKRISQIYPEDAELKTDHTYVLQQRSDEVRKSGKIDQSIAMAKKVVDEKPRHADSYLAVIDNYIKAGDYNNALVYSERALNQFPGHSQFIQKKVAVLEQQQRYPEILDFLNSQMKGGGSVALKNQYSYFLLEAARNAKNNDPANLYGKIFDGSPAHTEAFNHVFNHLVAVQQYDEALHVLAKHRSRVGNRKELDMKELMVYKRMDNQAKVVGLTRAYFAKYPNDVDLRDAYVDISLQRAKQNLQDGQVAAAIFDWQDAIQYGDPASIAIAKQGIYNAYITDKRYADAIVILDELLLEQPGDRDIRNKKADLYYKQGRFEYALMLYAQLMEGASDYDKPRYLINYAELAAPVVKDLRGDYKIDQAHAFVERWLAVDPHNQEALLAMINMNEQLKDYDAMFHYAQIAAFQHKTDMLFKIKLAEAMNHQSGQLPASWELLRNQVVDHAYHEPLVKSFSSTTARYADTLLKHKDHALALSVIDTALRYDDNNKGLKYTKGLAFEGLKQYDSAYYYQKFYDPSLLELNDFKAHLLYLSQRSHKNNVSIAHLRARYGDNYEISTISSVEYSRSTAAGSSYVGRVHYAGRDEGKGVQGQFEWNKPWADRWSTRADIALSNKYFARFTINAAALYVWKPTWELEGGVGYRNFFSGENMFNLNLGATKDIGDFKLSAKLNNYYLNGQGNGNYLYSLVTRAQYFMASPKNYILAVASVGNSPDNDLLDYQLYNSFNVFNAMVGAGVGHSITRNVSASVLGTWYNFHTDKSLVNAHYRNLYNLYFQLNVSF
ncbi:tetratricopeptide repeat protein [Sphingobacterium sp. SG20118]|uniref:tetratricopeptide repeat protein n=1 Tax=Sphingobacterium sp. SG20118 TaxID=3367156 RepID=UPI0037DFBF8A